MFIYLTVSTGPAVQTARMPSVVGQNVELAQRLLYASGFYNIEIQEVDSSKPQGEVLYQSVTAQKEVSTETKIVLRIPTIIVVTIPTLPSETDQPDDYIPKVVKIALPDDIMDDYVLTIYNGTTVVEERDIPTGTIYTEVVLYGKGTMKFQVMINQSVQWDITVDFDASNGMISNHCSFV